VLIFAVVLVAFLLIHIAPGDPLDAIIGDYPVSLEYRAELRARLALDRPLTEQLLAYLGSLARGQMGYSFRYGLSVETLVLQRLGATLLLMGSTLVFSTIVGIALGILAGTWPGSRIDTAITMLASVFYSLPVFVWGIILIMVFGVYLRWFPAGGYRSVSLVAVPLPQAILDTLWHLVLPVAALSARYIALLSRVTRSSMLEVRSEDYVTVARAKGLTERSVVARHIVRNALIPVATVAGLNFGLLLTGSAVLETVFAWPGMGLLMYDAMQARDCQVLQGVFLITSATVVLVNILTDMAYAKVDPRIGAA
jgi:ABC-type dipeptide/oligopeptide/nickel transport system permease component